MTAHHDRVLAALVRLLDAYESDVQLAPQMSVKRSWETNGMAIAEAREVIALGGGPTEDDRTRWDDIRLRKLRLDHDRS